MTQIVRATDNRLRAFLRGEGAANELVLRTSNEEDRQALEALWRAVLVHDDRYLRGKKKGELQ